jgi:hypothetical protein
VAAEFKDLVIRVKVEEEDSRDQKEKLEQLKKAFEDMGGGSKQKEDFEKIFRHTGNIEKQIKELTEGLASGSPLKAIVNFAATFGSIGLAAKLAYETVAGVFRATTDVAKGLVDLAFQAKRLGIHPAQLEKEIEQGRLAGITREAMVGIATHLRDRLAEFQADPAKKLELMEGLSFKQMRMMDDLIQRMLAAPQPQQLDIVLEGQRRILKEFENAPTVGAARADEWIKWWTGGIDLQKMKEDFKIVTEEDKAAMDKMIEASEAWTKMSGEMANNMERIVKAVTTNLINDPVFGAIIKAVNAWLEHAREQAENPKPEAPSVFEPDPNRTWRDWLNPFWNPLTPGYNAARPPAKPQGLMSTGFEDVNKEMEKQKDYTGELTEQFRRFNALISGEELTSADLASQLGIKSLPPDVQGNPAFHNQPMGGTAGESNPMTLPPGSPQPGGGAAAEAVGPTGRGWDIETQRKVRRAWPGTTDVVTGSGSWYGTYGAFKDIGQDKPGSASLGQMWGMKYFPEERQGIALRSAATLGRMFRVTWPDGSQTIEQHTDIGPAKSTGRAIDISAAAATRAGKTQAQMEALQSGKFTAEAIPTFGQEAQMQRAAAAASVGRPGGEGMALMGDVETTPTSALRPSVRSYQAAQRALQQPQQAQRAPAFPDEAAANYGEVSSAYPYLTDRLRIRPKEWERFLSETPKSTNIEDRRREDPYEGVDLPMREFNPLDRSGLDRGLAAESGVEAKGNLDVNVKAPAGTEVKAEGDGMFKGNVAMNRQIDLPTLQ